MCCYYLCPQFFFQGTGTLYTLYMAPEEMAAILQALNQLCYCAGGFALFVTYFVHNVSATVSYDQKELLNIRTAITHLTLDKDFFL